MVKSRLLTGTGAIVTADSYTPPPALPTLVIMLPLRLLLFAGCDIIVDAGGLDVSESV